MNLLFYYKCYNSNNYKWGDIMNNNLKTWRFAYDNDNQIKRVLLGWQTATTYLYNEKNTPNNYEEVLVFDNEKKACITKTLKIIITEFKNIDENLSKLEVEENFETWKKSHIKHFKTINPNFNENTKVVFKIFEVKENLTEKRLELANKIAKANQDIFGNISKIEEVNAGFNNSIFDVNDTFIIKVCDNIEKEKLFDTEANFYNSNKDNNNIPTLYKFDKSKSVIPYVYEIIEKVNGKTVYYHWYKMNEQEREKLIQKIVKILQKIHLKNYPEYNWSENIKNKILDSFNQTTDMFSEEEKDIILKSLDKYDEILSDNKFSLIHNDLHFDNILIDNNKNIKLIDFNDSIIAPFDYDLRLLYMSVETPWKWANIEMDPYQKPEDYKHLFEYIKKYYKELNNIKYLDERMLVYRILDDFKLLPRFRETEAKDRILLNSKKLLENLKSI